MEKMIRIGLGQMNSTVGDITGNGEKVIEWVERAKVEDVDILALPELAITGYPPEDLLLKKGFVDANMRTINEVASRIDSPVTIVGFVDRSRSGLHNAAAVIDRGKIRGVFR
jgi:NAD+ synthase (glutamine-hydrolysing)